MRVQSSTLRERTIANQYLHGELPAERAAALLRGTNPYGMLLAGEVISDHLTKDTPHMASTWSRTAAAYYKRVVAETDGGLWRDDFDHAGSRVKAQMRLAQLPALEAMHGRRAFPQTRTVKTMYGNLLRVAIEAFNSTHANTRDRVSSAMEVRGALGELAVLLLAQRHALREIGRTNWLPLQSAYPEKHGGDCLAKTGAYTWDLNVFTHADKNNTPTPTHRLQIRKHLDDADSPPVGPTLYISPDLSLRHNERWVSERIIASCEVEARSPEPAPQLTAELDARTKLLLDILEG